MIKLGTNDAGHLVVLQAFDRPLIYLDHWALRNIADSDEMSKRLSAALHAKGGTLSFSALNLTEFGKVSQPQREASEALLTRIGLEHLFVQDIDLHAVIDREDKAIRERLWKFPNADTEIVKGLLANGTDLRPLSTTGLAEAAVVPEVIASHDRLLVTVRDRLLEIRDLTLDPLPRKLLVAFDFPHGTRFLDLELRRALLADKQRKITTNDAADFLHAVVSVSYADHVLLDGPWVVLVERAKRALLDAGARFSLAKTYSKPDLDDFLAALEA